MRCDAGVEFMTDDYINEYISPAINDFIDLIAEKTAEKSVCFHIKNVITNPIHFQKEALYYAMVGWFFAYFDLNAAAFSYQYDIELRKFIFEN